MLYGKGNYCNRKESIAICDNTIKAELFGQLFENIEKTSTEAGKNSCFKKIMEKFWKSQENLEVNR